MKNFVARLAFIIATISSAVAQPTIPVSNISPMTGPSLVGRESGVSGRAQQITVGSGLEIQGGILTATGGGGGGAPTNATYITQTPNATLTNEQALSLLSTGIMYVTTGTGQISSLGAILPGAFGGTANGFMAFTGPTTSLKTFTLPNASATILTSATPVTPAQGGTGQSTWANGQVAIGNTTSGGLDKATLTAGTGVTITNSAGGITINATGSGGNVTGAGSTGDLAQWTSSSNITNIATSGTGAPARVGSPTFTGNIILATSATPSTTTAGTTAFDTNAWAANRGAAQIYDGTANTYVVATLASDTPTAGDTPIYQSNGTILWEPASSGSVTANATLASGNVIVGGGTTVVGPSNVTIAGNDMTVPGNISVGNVTTVNLTISGTITGVIPVENGGTELATLTSNAVITGNGTGPVGFVSPGTSGNVLTSNGTAWNSTAASGGNVTGSTLTANAIVLGNGSSAITVIASLGNSGAPLLSAGAGAPPAFGALNLAGGVNIVTGITPVANGGTGLSTITANAVLLGNTTGAVTTVSPGTSGNVLTSNGTTWTSSAATGGGSLTKVQWTAADNQPPASNYATFDVRNTVALLNFDAGTDESAVFVKNLPEGTSLTTGLSVYLKWTAASATSGDCVWVVSWMRCNTDIGSDSFATGVSQTTTTSGTSGIPNTTQIDFNGTTEIDGLTVGDMFRLKVTRDADAGGDTMTGDAQLLTVEVRQR